MTHSRQSLNEIAGASGFRPEYVEKALWLMDLLDGLMRHPFLEGKLALKGGTALNLFCYPLPRLSVDIDLNYVGAADRATMLAERPTIEAAVLGVCQRLGLSVRRQPDEHSGGKWSLRYPSAITPGGNLELDLNFLLRTPLWPTARSTSAALGDRRCADVLVLDIHELAAGKLAALFARSAPRDVFDAARLLADPRLDGAKLRTGFVAYGAMSPRDWREVGIADIAYAEEQFRSEVAVLLGSATSAPEAAAAALVQCRDLVRARLLPLAGREVEFLRLVNEEGIVRPELVTEDLALRAVLQAHPALAWKAENVRKHRGL